MSKDQYVAADEAKLTEIIRQAESRLDAQLQVGIAADQRAMTFAGILATATAALIAWAIGHDWGDQALWPIVLMIAGLSIASGFALWSAQPVAWELTGNTPASWIDDIADGRDDLRSAKAAMASFYADMIQWNHDRLDDNSWTMRLSLWAVILTLTIGGVIAVMR